MSTSPPPADPRPPSPLSAAITWSSAPCALGWVLVASTTQGVRSVLLGDEVPAREAELAERFAQAPRARNDAAMAPIVAAVVRCVSLPREPHGLTLDPHGTPFQRKVWQALQALPPGSTTTYGALASALASAQSTRAVATAIGANPIAVLIPCHRVVGASGQLTGFRWGLERKRRLLDAESGQAGLGLG